MPGTSTTPTRPTEHLPCIQKTTVKASEEVKGNIHNHENGIASGRPVSTSTPNFNAKETAASSIGKRKVDCIDAKFLPPAKRIHTTVDDSRERIYEPKSEDKSGDYYKYMTRINMRHMCRTRSLPSNGSKKTLQNRLKLYDAALDQAFTTQNYVEEDSMSSRAEPSDQFTHMSQKDLRKECVERSLPVGLAKPDLRRCLRLYDAARALGLTPEESLEAQSATFQHCLENYGPSINAQEPIGETTFGSVSEKAAEGHALGSASRESIMESGHRRTSIETSGDDTSPSRDSQPSSGNKAPSPSVTTLDSPQDCGTSDIYPVSAATPDYASMDLPKLRSLCKARSLKQHGFTGSQLRVALIAHDRILAKQASRAEVEVEAERISEKVGVIPSLSRSPSALIDLESSSQDEEVPEKRTRLVRKEPLSSYLWAVKKVQSPPVSVDARVEASHGVPMEQASAKTFPEKGPYISPYSPQPVTTAPKRIDNESSSLGTPYNNKSMSPQQPLGNESSSLGTPDNNESMSLQQPLVSLFSRILKDTKSDADEIAYQRTQMKKNSLSERAIKVAEKETFNAKFAPGSPYWICCCAIPSYEVVEKKLADFSGNCIYHVSELAQRGIFTVKEYQEYLVTQQALDQTESCVCQKPAVDHPEHSVTMTQGGFILAQIWREQLMRRHVLTVYRPDMQAYRRQGILEVMQNVHDDFMIELSSQQPKRPLVLWARIESMAWFINDLPMNNEWHYFRDWRRPRHYIMLFGIALLTTIDTLLRQSLFKDNEPKVPNLGLVIALFVQSTWHSPSSTLNSFDSNNAYKPPFNNDICVNNENGWAAEVVSLTEKHGVRIIGVKNINRIVDQCRLRKKSYESIRDWARKKRWAFSHNEGTKPPSDATLASIAAKEGESPAKRGTGLRSTVRVFRISIWAVRFIMYIGKRLLPFIVMFCSFVST